MSDLVERLCAKCGEVLWKYTTVVDGREFHPGCAKPPTLRQQIAALKEARTADEALMRRALAALDGLYLPGELKRVNAAIIALRERLGEKE